MKVNNPSITAKRILLKRKWDKEYQTFIDLKNKELCKDIDSILLIELIKKSHE